MPSGLDLSKLYSEIMLFRGLMAWNTRNKWLVSCVSLWAFNYPCVWFIHGIMPYKTPPPALNWTCLLSLFLLPCVDLHLLLLLIVFYNCYLVYNSWTGLLSLFLLPCIDLQHMMDFVFKGLWLFHFPYFSVIWWISECYTWQPICKVDIGSFGPWR